MFLPLTALWPRLDEPLNLYHSQAQSWVTTLSQLRAQIYMLDRVRRRVEVRLPGLAHPVVWTGDIRHLQHPDTDGHYAYLPLLYGAQCVETEQVRCGESVPVQTGGYRFYNAVPYRWKYFSGKSYAPQPPAGCILHKSLLYVPAALVSDPQVTVLQDWNAQDRREGVLYQYRILLVPLAQWRTAGSVATADAERYLHPAADRPLADFHCKFDMSRYRANPRTAYTPYIARHWCYTYSSDFGMSNWDLYNVDSNYQLHLVDRQSAHTIHGASATWWYRYGPAYPHTTRKLRVLSKKLSTDSVCVTVYDPYYTSTPKLLPYPDSADLEGLAETATTWPVDYHSNDPLGCPDRSTRPYSLRKAVDKDVWLPIEEALLTCYLHNINLRYFLYTHNEPQVQALQCSDINGANYLAFAVPEQNFERICMAQPLTQPIVGGDISGLQCSQAAGAACLAAASYIYTYGPYQPPDLVLQHPVHNLLLSSANGGIGLAEAPWIEQQRILARVRLDSTPMPPYLDAHEIDTEHVVYSSWPDLSRYVANTIFFNSSLPWDDLPPLSPVLPGLGGSATAALQAATYTATYSQYHMACYRLHSEKLVDMQGLDASFPAGAQVYIIGWLVRSDTYSSKLHWVYEPALTDVDPAEPTQRQYSDARPANASDICCCCYFTEYTPTVYAPTSAP